MFLVTPAHSLCHVTQQRFIRMHMTITGSNSSLDSPNVCYHWAQNLLSSSLLFKNIKITTYRIMTLPVLYGCETWSLTLREEQRLVVFENRVVRKLLGAWKDERDTSGVEKTA